MMVSKEGRGFMPRLRDNCAKGAGSTAIMAPGDRMRLNRVPTSSRT